MDDLIPVRVRECPDGSHPEGDHVYILPKLGLEGGIAARQDLEAVRATYPITSGDMDEKGNPTSAAGRAFDAALVRSWMVTFCKYGAVAWTLHDDGGEVWPFDVSTLLDDAELGFAVADRADDFYRMAVIRPLALRAQTRSPGGRTSDTTSRKTPLTGSPRKRSSPRPSAGTPSPDPIA